MSLVTLEINDVADVIDEAITRHVLVSHNDNKASKLFGDLLSFKSDLQELKTRINEDNRFEEIKSYIEVRISTIELSLSSLKDLIDRYGKIENKLDNYTSSERFTKELAYLREDVDREKANVNDFVLKRLDEIRESIVPLVRDEIGRIPLPKDGQDGNSVSIEDVVPFIAEKVIEEVAKIPVPKDGIDGIGHDGKDGESVTLDDVRPFILSEIASNISALPIPKDGEPGSPGKPGKDGVSVDLDDIKSFIIDKISEIPLPRDGRDGTSIDLDVVRTLIEKEVAKIPLPQNGRDGVNGKNIVIDDVIPIITVEIEKRFLELPQQKDGMDGVGLAGAIIDRGGELVVTCTNGSVISLGKVVGRDGLDGKDIESEKLKDLTESIQRFESMSDRVNSLEEMVSSFDKITTLESELSLVKELVGQREKSDLTDDEFARRVHVSMNGETV